MLGRLDDGGPQVRLSFEGAALLARPGDSVAAALLAAGERVLRTTPARGTPRGPFCMMGACFDCLVEIDGVSNRQACMVEVAEGMEVRRQQGAAGLPE
jgi:predicted molibdopterin-dependent oxidoreductase YjgC